MLQIEGKKHLNTYYQCSTVNTLFGKLRNLLDSKNQVKIYVAFSGKTESCDICKIRFHALKYAHLNTYTLP